ncbi:MAG TPA: HD-GYP domain-containing protein [Burkholderiaceae bacterium]|nr:HD-GYP domain-containing protein [Burkholderiaceae bacterium]
MAEVAEQPAATGDGPDLPAHKRFQLAVKDLEIGMFVAELDRPWLDTPFILQGFLIDSQVEKQTLQKYCRYVYVDLELSAPEVADAIRRAQVIEEPAAAPAPAPAAVTVKKPAAPKRASGPKVYRPRSDPKVSQNTRSKFRQLVKAASGVDPNESDKGPIGRLIDWLLVRLGLKKPARRRASSESSKDALRAWLPTNIDLQEYEELRPVEQELPRARQTFATSEEVIKAVASDIRQGKVVAVENVQAVADDMVESMVDNPDALMWVARLREEDVTTYNHGVKVALYLVSLGRHLGFPKKELGYLAMIGMLADIGKTKLPRALLEKPGMLSASEYNLVKEHVRLSLEVLRKREGKLPVEVEQGIAQHHERLDGTGYPKGLKGDEISIWGRMAAVADSFAALITPRAYANAAAPQDALLSLFEWAGSSFHEPLVEQFVQAVGVFPVGSLCELSSGEVAVVVAHNRVRRLEPKVLVLTASDKTPLAKPVERDLLQQKREEGTKPLRIVRGLAAGAYGLKLRDYYMGEIAKANDLPS